MEGKARCCARVGGRLNWLEGTWCPTCSFESMGSGARDEQPERDKVIRHDKTRASKVFATKTHSPIKLPPLRCSNQTRWRPKSMPRRLTTTSTCVILPLPGLMALTQHRQTPGIPGSRGLSTDMFRHRPSWCWILVARLAI